MEMIKMTQENLEQKVRRILVIEDNPEHLADAKKYFATVTGVEVAYATDYVEFCKRLSDSTARIYEERKAKVKEGEKVDWPTIQETVDGIISDIYFPYDAHYLEQGHCVKESLEDMTTATTPQNLGIGIALICETAKIPYVLCTSGYHHGAKYQPVCSITRKVNELISDDVKAKRIQRSYGCTVIDGVGEMISGTAEHKSKNWKQAYNCLNAQMDEKDQSTK